MKKGLALALSHFVENATYARSKMYRPQEVVAMATEACALADELSIMQSGDPTLAHLKWLSQKELAQAWSVIGEKEKAVTLGEEVLAQAKAAWRADPGNITLRGRVAESALHLSWHISMISPQRSLSVEREAREQYRLLRELDPSNQDWAWGFAKALHGEAMSLAFGECLIESARKAFKELDAVVAPSQDLDEGFPRLSWWICTYGAVLAAQAGDLADARAQTEEAQKRFEHYLHSLPDNVWDRRIARIDFLQNLTGDFGILEDWPALEHVARENADLVEAELRERPTDPELLLGRPMAWGWLGLALKGEGRSDEATPLLEQALADFRDTPLTANLNWAYLIENSIRENLAELTLQHGDIARARTLLELNVKANEARRVQELDRWPAREALATTQMKLGITYAATDRTATARRADLLAQAAALLDSPDAEGRITMQGKATKAKIAGLRGTAPASGDVRPDRLSN